jgi:hypothetical protein
MPPSQYRHDVVGLEIGLLKIYTSQTTLVESLQNDQSQYDGDTVIPSYLQESNRSNR